MTIIQYGIVWVVVVSGGWYKCIKAFPEARDSKGEPLLEHPNVLKYIKDRTT